MTNPSSPPRSPGGGNHHDWRQLKSALPQPPDPRDREDLLWQQLEAHFAWYDRAAGRSKVAYLIFKVATIVVGAVVTVLAASDAPPVRTATLAALAVIAEGVQQVFKFHTNWITYRATAEALRTHAFQYAAQTGSYRLADRTARRERLADALNLLVATENTSWTTSMRDQPPDANKQ